MGNQALKVSRRALQETGGNWLYQEEKMMTSRETNVGKHEECIGCLKVHISARQFKKNLFFKIQDYTRLLGEAFNDL